MLNFHDYDEIGSYIASGNEYTDYENQRVYRSRNIRVEVSLYECKHCKNEIAFSTTLNNISYDANPVIVRNDLEKLGKLTPKV